MKFQKFVISLIAIFLFIVTGCNNSKPNIPEEKAKVKFYQMKNFSSVEEDSLITFTD
ncbi:hypothetical protein [Lederbergia citrea]|uniref:hypothetical protein n=1 Tax=Lederbergia citrea TaxID=2833581 RepID=UPI001BC9A209|nr:hypothetical protein [Lederbergia citrea]MBS4176996.1 hypothetical protein [Lederbergia citrea]MBS4203569.1 hypothetical protein [Lederbergia citrea]